MAALALAAPLLPGVSGEPFVAVDFETATPQRDSACSVALVRVEGERIVRVRHTLLRPSRPSSELAHIHRITAEMQERAPLLADAWPELAPMLDGVGLLVAHNASFDQSVMRTSWAAAGLTPPGLPWACTVEMARRIWPGLPSYSLGELARVWRIPLRHHEALSDARACAELVLRARAVERGELFLPWKPKAASAPVAAPAPLPPTSPDTEARRRCVELIELGRDARAQGGDILRLQEEIGHPVEAALVSCGWMLEDLDRDLRRRGDREGVRVEPRLDGLLQLLHLPRGAQPDFSRVVRQMRALQRERRSRYGRQTPDERRELSQRCEEAEEAVDEMLALLPQEGR